MKAVTAFFVVLALVMFIASPAFAAKDASAAQPQSVVREALEPQSLPPEGEVAPLPVRSAPTAALLPIPPGVYTVGVAGTYPTLSAAVSALKTNGVTGGGTVFFRLTDPLYSDTGQTIGGYPGQGPLAPVVFDVAPGILARVLFTGGTTASNSFGIRIDSASSVTIDGSGIGPAGRSLTLDCDTATTVNRNGIVIQRGSKDIAIKNCIILGNRRVANNGFGIIRIVNTGFAALGGQNNILIENNWLLRGLDGIQHLAAGTATLVLDTNLVIRGNLIGGAGSSSFLDNLTSFGITCQGAVNSLVENNDVYGIKQALAATNLFGMSITGGCVNVTVRGNKVHDVVFTTLAPTGRPQGLNFQGGPVNGGQTRTVIYAYNNMVYDLHSFTSITSSRAYRGICLGAFAGNSATTYLYNNTINIVTAAGEVGGPGGPTGFGIDFNGFGGGGALADTTYIYNNILSHKRGTDFSRSYLMFASATMGVFADNNLFYQPDGGGFAQWPSPWPVGPGAVVDNMAAWSAATGNDLASRTGNPLFVSDFDNHIITSVGSVSPADSLGTPLALVSTDIDAQPRNAVKPDAGVDEFNVTRFTLDVGAVSVDFPPTTQIIAAGAPFSPQATFVNPGSVSHASLPVKVEIFDAVPALVYTGTATIAIGGYGNTALATFAPPASLPAGSYTITATSLLPGDLNPANDAVTSSLFVQASVSTLPYSIDFEAGAPGWITNATSGSANDWVVGTPAKTQILGAFSGTKCWVTKTTGVYTSPQESFINLPILNLTTFTGTLLVQFYNNFQTEDTWDGGELQISLNGGLSWTKVDSTIGTPPAYNTPTSTAWYNQDTAWIGDPNYGWSGSSAGYAGDVAGWVRSSTAIAGLSGLPDVRFRWAFRGDDNTAFDGWAIDDVLIKKVDPDDISLATLGIPGYVGGPVPELVSVGEPNAKSRTNNMRTRNESGPSLGAFTTAAPITFNAEVRNAGVNPQPAYTVGWELDAAPQAPVANTDPLPFGGSQILPLTWATPTTGFHNVRAYTQLAADLNTSNDSASFDFEVLAPEVVFYEGFNGPQFPPPDWDTVNNDGNTGSLRNWYQSAGYPYDGAFGARGNYNTANDDRLIDDWLITPNIGVPPLETTYYIDSLTFQLTGQSATYADSLMILVSTTTDDISAFTTVLDYVLADPVDYRRLAYALPTGYKYVAFRYLLYDGGPVGSSSDNIYLDDVRVTRHTFANTFLATPNNVNFGILSIGFSSTQAVKVKNPGNLPLVISAVTSSDNTNFAVTATTGTLLPGDSTTVLVTFQPTTVGVKSDTIVFVHDADSTPDTVIATGQGAAAILFTSLSPDSVLLENPLKPFNPTKPVKRFKGFYPNWSNLLDEVVAQGGFQPGTSESDSAGGARIGVSFMFLKDAFKQKWAVNKAVVEQYHWMRLTKWDFKKSVGKSFNALQKTLIDKTGRHMLAPRGLDFTTDGKNKPLKGQYTKLTPKKHSNKLLAEMVALKVNIAASAIGKTPAGFGELVFNRPGHPFHGRTVKQISADVDTGMTYFVNPIYVQAYYDSALLAVSLINRSFVGPLDTVSWEAGGKDVAQLVVKGAVNLAGAPFLSLPPGPFVVTRVTPANNLTESPEDFEDEEFEDGEGMPVAAKLYQNYPNPFNPSTTIAFRLREESKVSIRIFNLLGQQVASLIDGEELEEGVQEIQFAATNLASGIYFYQIDAQGLGDDAMKTIETRKMLLVK